MKHTVSRRRYSHPRATGALCRARRAHDWYDITADVSWCRDCGMLRELIS